MARGHLRKSELAGERRDALLVRRIAVGVHEYDRDGRDPVGVRPLERGAGFGEIGLALDRAVGAHPLVDLDDALVENIGLDDVAGKNLRARLISDFQRVAKAPGGDEQRALALALQQRIGRDRGAHLDRADAVPRDRLARGEPQKIADTLDGGVAIGLRIVREQLVGDERAVRPTADHVGERAAAVDPELPALIFGGHRPLRSSSENSVAFRGPPANAHAPRTPHRIMSRQMRSLTRVGRPRGKTATRLTGGLRPDISSIPPSRTGQGSWPRRVPECAARQPSPARDRGEVGPAPAWRSPAHPG